jgi:hypothetical protein
MVNPGKNIHRNQCILEIFVFVFSHFSQMNGQGLTAKSVGRGYNRRGTVILPVWAFCSIEILRLSSSRLFKTLFTQQAMRTDITTALMRKFLMGDMTDMTITAAIIPPSQSSSVQCSAEKES